MILNSVVIQMVTPSYIIVCTLQLQWFSRFFFFFFLQVKISLQTLSEEFRFLNLTALIEVMLRTDMRVFYWKACRIWKAKLHRHLLDMFFFFLIVSFIIYCIYVIHIYICIHAFLQYVWHAPLLNDMANEILISPGVYAKFDN